MYTYIYIYIYTYIYIYMYLYICIYIYHYIYGISLWVFVIMGTKICIFMGIHQRGVAVGGGCSGLGHYYIVK